MRMHVFRSGPLVKQAHSGDVAKVYMTADAVCPDGRARRAESLFCSPSLLGVSRWLRGNLLCLRDSEDVSVREVVVRDAEGVDISGRRLGKSVDFYPALPGPAGGAA
jgi:hypothetical protein